MECIIVWEAKTYEKQAQKQGKPPLGSETEAAYTRPLIYEGGTPFDSLGIYKTQRAAPHPCFPPPALPDAKKFLPIRIHLYAEGWTNGLSYTGIDGGSVCPFWNKPQPDPSLTGFPNGFPQDVYKRQS